VERERRTPNVAVGDCGDDYPMITALYENYQAHCLQQQVLAELRGDDPSDAVTGLIAHH
jgi:hypothetical protein